MSFLIQATPHRVWQIEALLLRADEWSCDGTRLTHDASQIFIEPESKSQWIGGQNDTLMFSFHSEIAYQLGVRIARQMMNIPASNDALDVQFAILLADEEAELTARKERERRSEAELEERYQNLQNAVSATNRSLAMKKAQHDAAMAAMAQAARNREIEAANRIYNSSSWTGR